VILLDTHALFWARANPQRLPARARTAIEGANALAVSDITLWELAMLARKDRIAVADRLDAYLADIAASCRVLPITPDIAAVVAGLGADSPIRDPADQIIWATSTVHRLPLVSADSRLRSHDPAVVWD
jgi:PIN domain nuclease of toxin-antitoxin system